MKSRSTNIIGLFLLSLSLHVNVLEPHGEYTIRSHELPNDLPKIEPPKSEEPSLVPA
jgi:hypothetical protein